MASSESMSRGQIAAMDHTANSTDTDVNDDGTEGSISQVVCRAGTDQASVVEPRIACGLASRRPVGSDHDLTGALGSR